jgi:deoxyribodipyrimidine photo-lyase
VSSVPALRLSAVNQAPINPQGRYVLYWMIAQRRATYNFGLQRAVERAAELKKPLVVLEPLRVGYRWASDRLHAFVLQGMKENAARFASTPALYHPYVEPAPGAGRGLLEALAKDAALVITDDWPCFFLPRMVAAAGARLPVLLEQVDATGLLPYRAAKKAFSRAFDFRRFLQKNLLPHLHQRPRPDPLAGVALPRLDALPAEVAARWPRATEALLHAQPEALRALPIDHDVAPASFVGGTAAAEARWREFLATGLARYGEGRNHPDADASSRLSPWLHFGHLGVHQLLEDVIEKERWSPQRVSGEATGENRGWWGMSEAAESFLDELVTWREVGLNACAYLPDYDRFESLPAWARTTIDEHRLDERPHRYELPALEAARTHDPLWNAAQRELVREGRMHNYLRMLWGKKVYEWSASPEQALANLIELNNKYAVDGRDPNSYAGIFWVFGRYDRAWGPERPIFGKLRYMTSENTQRKLELRLYLRKYGQR